MNTIDAIKSYYYSQMYMTEDFEIISMDDEYTTIQINNLYNFHVVKVPNVFINKLKTIEFDDYKERNR